MLKLPEEVKKVLGEQYEQRLAKPVTAVQLPCTRYHAELEPVIVQLDVPGDKSIKCPLCGRMHYLVWSSLGNHKWQK